MAIIMNLEQLFAQMRRNSIGIQIGGARRGLSHFGGKPMLPPDFVFPTYADPETGDVFLLAFIAQLDCAELKPFDLEGLLPEKGLLSFFYELETMRRGFDPRDKGSAKVCYFEDPSALAETPLPDANELPELGMSFSAEPSYPDGADLQTVDNDLDFEVYDALRERLSPYPSNKHKLFGWADVIQNSMPAECELVSLGEYLGSGYPKRADINEIRRRALDEWIPLFQLDTVSEEDFELMFGDCGRIFYYIRRSDLKKQNFDQAWLILQC